MRRRSRAVRFLPVLLVMAGAVDAGSSASATEPDLLERALETHERFDHREWAYTLTIVEDGKTTVARHDPTRPDSERWTLVSIDARPPTDREYQEFREEHTTGSEEDSESSSGGEVRAMISPGSAKLVEETAEHAVYTFESAGEDEEERKFNRNLAATLRIAKNGADPFVESIEMRADKPFSAAMGIKIKEFSTVMTFAPVGTGQAVLPVTVEMRLQGRALLVKKIEQTVDVRYTDYRLVEETPAD